MDLAEVKQLIDSGKVEYVKIGSPDIEGVYRGKRVAAQHFLQSLEEGFALYDPPLEHFELFWEKSLDTKLLLAWNQEVILLSFRGTASMSNVFADIQVRAKLCSA